MVRYLIFVLMIIATGCVQTSGPNPLPDEPDDQQVTTPSEITNRMVSELRSKVSQSDGPRLKRYSAIYLAAADALEQSQRPAGVVLQAVKQMPEEFVSDRLQAVGDALKVVMPVTQDPEKNRQEIAKSFRAASAALLILSK